MFKGGLAMKQLLSIETMQYSLEVVECDCGFHLGIDATWLDQNDTAFVNVECPACSRAIPIDELTKP
jgi:hypothetical protein